VCFAPALLHSGGRWLQTSPGSQTYSVTLVSGQVTGKLDFGNTLVSPWQNPANKYDVSGDGWVVPTDALVIINYLNAHPGDFTLPQPSLVLPPFVDVTGDNFCTPLDVLNVINFLNAQAAGEGERDTGFTISIPNLVPLDQIHEFNPPHPAQLHQNSLLHKPNMDGNSKLRTTRLEGYGRGPSSQVTWPLDEMRIVSAIHDAPNGSLRDRLWQTRRITPVHDFVGEPAAPLAPCVLDVSCFNT
jgi:hypothetical protein